MKAEETSKDIRRFAGREFGQSDGHFRTAAVMMQLVLQKIRSRSAPFFFILDPSLRSL